MRGISQRILTVTREQLHLHGLVSRTAYTEARHAWSMHSLTSGPALQAVLALSTWARAHHEAVAANRRDSTPPSEASTLSPYPRN